ncbi:cytochrome b561 [Noviherbaspirillum suwonense]|uniref:Cytochrome b561 n=2 Tax=Noviherbaspirillum suwonense TaxID=1224511 RepID=A0ABY1Q0F6_9BURK|nr:cytochrome b561 [Noviherbaspirillum suwonense]
MESRSMSSSARASGYVSPSGAPIARYSWQAMLLHWLLAVIVIGMLCLGYLLDDMARGPTKDFYVEMHRSFGVTALVLVFLRLAWRMRRTPPPLPASVPRWQRIAAAVTHGLLYLCILLQPLSGYLASSFGRSGIHYFGMPLPHWGWDDKPLRTFFGEVHGIVATALVVLIAIHVLAALKHLFINRDQVFQRMLPARRKP